MRRAHQSLADGVFGFIHKLFVPESVAATAAASESDSAAETDAPAAPAAVADAVANAVADPVADDVVETLQMNEGQVWNVDKGESLSPTGSLERGQGFEHLK